MTPAVSPSLARASARRAAVAASLAALAADDARLARLVASRRAALTDDLCRYAALADACEASDAALARAAAEDLPAVSLAARIAYRARLLLRTAGMVFGARESEETATGIWGADAEPAAGRARLPSSVPTLDAALEALRGAGIARACASRGLVEAMAGAQTRAGGVVGRLLVAACSADAADLSGAACGPPFFLDPAILRDALAQGARADGSARAALASAIPFLHGAAAKEAALAVVGALDAAWLERSDEPPALEGAVSRVAQAVGAFALATSSGGDSSLTDPGARPLSDAERDAVVEELRVAARAADDMWARVSPPAPVALRVATLLDCVARAQLTSGLTLVAGEAGGEVEARLVFLDSEHEPIAWSSFAGALEIPPQRRASAQKSEAPVLRVESTLDRALASYLAGPASPARSGAGAAQARVWPQAEPARAFAAPAMTFSASRLNAYVKCPRRWFYEYLCQALDDPGSLHATYGRVVHDALEALHREVRVPSRHAPGLILERFLRELDLAFGKARDDFASQLEYEVSRLRARRMAEQYVRWLVTEAQRAPMEIAHVELLQRSRFGAHEFVGYIDRIDRPLGGGPVTIYDYKTGRVDTDAAEYLDKVRRGDEAQLPLYYFLRRASGDEVARIALVSIRDPRDEAWILALDIVDDGSAPADTHARDGVVRAACSRADLEASLAVLLERADALTGQGMAHYPPGADPPCDFCAYARACRERPPDGERIFAR